MLRHKKVLTVAPLLMLSLCWLFYPHAAYTSGYSCFNFKFYYNNGSGDYYSGYVYAPTDFQTSGPQITVGKYLYQEPAELGLKTLNGYYYITGITDGYSASSDKQCYVTSYYDNDTYGKALGVNPDGSATAGNVFVSNRTQQDERGYVITNTPLSYYVPEHQGGSISSSGYAWSYSYDIGYYAAFGPYQEADNPREFVDLDIKLTGDDPGAALKDTWEDGIEAVWNDQYRITAGDYRIPIELDIEWVTSGQDQQVVVVNATDTNRQTNMSTWYTDQPGGWANSYAGKVIAHELGHMLGLYDEYAGGATNPANYITNNALMADLGPVQERYYSGFLTWLKGKTGLTTLQLEDVSP